MIYVSRVVGTLAPHQLRSLLHLARRGNRRRDVTGILVCTGQSFLQVLEGDADALAPLIESIAKDTRHRDVRILSRRAIAQRTHGDWDMALISSPDFAERIDALIDEPDVAIGDLRNLIEILAQRGRLEDGGLSLRFSPV